MKTTPFSTPETLFIETLLSVSERIQKFAEGEILENLTILQFNILGELRYVPNLKVGDINKHLIASSASLSQTLKRMERDELIGRTLSNTDKRVIQVYITNKGKTVYDISNHRYISVAKKKLQFIDSEDLSIITKILSKINISLENVSQEKKKFENKRKLKTT